MITSLLSIAQGAATSAEFTVPAGVVDRVFLVDADGEGVPFRSEATVQRKGSGNQFQSEAWLDFWHPSAEIQGPGTFRVVRSDGVSVGVDRDNGTSSALLVGGDGLTLGGQALTAGQRAQVRAGIGLLNGIAYVKPAEFDWNPPIRIWRSGNDLKTDFSPESWMAPTNAVLWSSISRGSDTTGNGTFATPYKSIWKAISAMSAATTIYVEAGVYDRNNSFKSQTISHPCNVIAVGGEVVSSQRWEGGAWSAVAGGAYAATRSTVGMVVDMADTDSMGLGRRLKKVASQALCEAEAGTWATDNTSVWVHTTDGRSPDSSVLVMIDLPNCRISTDGHFYARGVNFEGSSAGNIATDTALLTSASKIILDKCKLTYSKTNGVSCTGVGLFIANECAFFGNLMDGANYHRGGNLVNVKALEINCVQYGCGDSSDTADNDNGSTAHEACRVVRVGTTGDGMRGPIFADVDDSMSWNIGCYAGTSLAATVAVQNSGFQALNNAKMWLEDCVSVGSVNRTYATSAQILARGGDVGAVPSY